MISFQHYLISHGRDRAALLKGDGQQKLGRWQESRPDPIVWVIGQFQKTVKKSDPVFHFHEYLTLCTVLREVQIGGNDAVQFFDMLLAEIVLGDDHIRLQYFTAGRVFPIRQTHINFGCVGRGINNFRGGFAGDGPVQFILNGGEKSLVRGASLL